MMNSYTIIMYIHTQLTISFPCRCRANNATTSRSPELCHEYYTFGNGGNIAIYDRAIPPGITQALHDTLLNISSNTSNYPDHCVQLLGSYLCHYYFPICRVNRNDIEPVCRSSCNLLLNDDNCSDLLMTALDIIAEHNVTLLPDDDLCVMTYRSYNGSGTPGVSSNCRNIEGQNQNFRSTQLLLFCAYIASQLLG